MAGLRLQHGCKKCRAEIENRARRISGRGTPCAAALKPLSRGLRSAGSATRTDFGARRPRPSTGTRTPTRVFDPTAGVYGRWFVGAVCNTCFNAVDRHVLRGRGDQTAIIYDSPVTGTKRTITYRRTAGRGEDARRRARRPRRRPRRPRHPLHADGAGGGDRHARLRAHRRDPFGGVRRLCGARAGDAHRRRQAEGDPVGELRHRARPHRALQAAARRSDHARRRKPAPA